MRVVEFEVAPKSFEVAPKSFEVREVEFEVAPKLFEVREVEFEVAPKLFEVAPKSFEVAPKLLGWDAAPSLRVKDRSLRRLRQGVRAMPAPVALRSSPQQSPALASVFIGDEA